MDRNINYKELPTFIKVILILSFPIIITLTVILTYSFGIIGFIISMGLIILLVGPALIINVFRNREK